MKINPDKLGAIKKKVKEFYSKKQCRISDSAELFGTLKIWFDDDKAWVFFRTSRTEHSMFRIIADAPSEDLAVKLLKEAVKILNPWSSKKA
jgi:phosphomannomutase